MPPPLLLCPPQLERRFDVNSVHLWLCAQPPSFDWKSIKSLTPAQDEECQELAEVAYFGPRTTDRDVFRTLDRNLPWPRPKYKNCRNIFLAKTLPPTASLGRLDRLPLEILHEIISLLDIAAVDQLKVVNRGAYAAVNCHPQFKLLHWEANDTLRAIRAIKISQIITVQTLFEKLCTSRCVECGEYGGYMYLLTLKRVCCRCFENHTKYSPMQEVAALKNFGLTPEILGSLPRFQSYPGLYGDAIYRDSPQLGFYIPLVDRESAHHAGIALHGSEAAMKEFAAKADPSIWKSYKKEIDEREKKHWAERAAKNARIYYRKRNALRKELWARKWARKRERQRTREKEREGQVIPTDRPGSQHGDDQSRRDDSDNESISTVGPTSDSDKDHDEDDRQLRAETDRRERNATNDRDMTDDEDLESCYMAMMRVPWLNKQAQRGEWGFHCVGCQANSQWPNHFRRDFDLSAFREHVKTHGPVRDGVHHSNGCCEDGRCMPDPGLGLGPRPSEPRLFWRA